LPVRGWLKDVVGRAKNMTITKSKVKASGALDKCVTAGNELDGLFIVQFKCIVSSCGYIRYGGGFTVF